MSDAAAQRLTAQVARRLGAFDFRCDLDLPLAGLTALFGASGAGKTTLINLVAGLLRPDEGRIAVGDTVFCDRAAGTDLPVEQRALGVVFQDARLFPHLTARQNLMFGFRRARGRARDARIGFDAVVELLGLAALLARRPHTLSGGEKQRVAIGRALLAQPRLLLMDEPLASLDAARKAEVLPYIERLRDEFGVPILYVSHSVDEVLRLATALVILDRGRTLVAGSLAEALSLPAAWPHFGGAEAGALVYGSVRAHDAHYALSTIDCDGFALRVPQVPLAPGTAVRVRIPAREVTLALSPPTEVSVINRIEGVIDALLPREDVAAAPSPYMEARVRVGRTTMIAVAVTRESTDRLGLAPGMRCWCLVKSVALDAAALALASGLAARRETDAGATAAALVRPGN